MASALNMLHGKMSGFLQFSFFGFTFAIKLRNFDFESHLNILTLEIDVVSDLNMSNGKISDFISFPLFGFFLVIKLINFNFESH